MKAKYLHALLCVLGFSLILHANWLGAQGNRKTLSILYSNNINGEIDPCPG
jgi:hypothetical protein